MKWERESVFLGKRERKRRERDYYYYYFFLFKRAKERKKFLIKRWCGNDVSKIFKEIFIKQLFMFIFLRHSCWRVTSFIYILSTLLINLLHYSISTTFPFHKQLLIFFIFSLSKKKIVLIFFFHLLWFFIIFVWFFCNSYFQTLFSYYRFYF